MTLEFNQPNAKIAYAKADATGLSIEQIS